MKQFFNLKSNFYFLQKLVFAIFCFSLGFLVGSGILKAKAVDETIVEYEFSYNLINCDNYDFTDKIKELDEALERSGYNYSIGIEYDRQNKCYLGFEHVRIYNSTPLAKDIFASDAYVGLFDTYYADFAGWRRFTINEENLNLIINKVKNLEFSQFYKGTTYLYQSLTQSNYILYNSSFEVSNGGRYTFKFNDLIVNQGDSFPKVKDFISKTKVYTEDYSLSTKNIKQIEYTFDLENKNNIIHEFNFSTSLNMENATFDIFDYPYLQYTKGGITYELPLNLKTDETGNQLIYFDTQINNFIDISELKFIVPNEKLVDIEADLHIHFDSSLNYTRKVYYKDDDIPEVQFYNVYKVNDIDHIEVEFDLTDIPESALIPNNEEYFKFEMKYDIKLTTDSRGYNLSNDVTLDVPRIEYMKVGSDGIIDTSTYGLSNNRLNRYNKYFDKDSYTNTYLVNYEFNRTLKLIINCRDIDDVYLSLKINATLNHNIKIFYRENVEDYRKYYQTIDLKGKYAAVFIPKIRLNNGENSVSSYFISSGNFRVEERDTYKNEFTLYKDPVNVTGKNQYYYFYGLPGELHKNDSFYYKNLNYPGIEEATIQYDSRYFVVSLCENDYKCETIVNPNTGEEITPAIPSYDGEWNIDRIFKTVDEFLDQVKDTGDYFNECFNAFWEKVPFPLQTIIIILYIMLHIIVFVRIGGWNSD